MVESAHQSISQAPSLKLNQEFYLHAWITQDAEDLLFWLFKEISLPWKDQTMLLLLTAESQQSQPVLVFLTHKTISWQSMMFTEEPKDIWEDISALKLVLHGTWLIWPISTSSRLPSERTPRWSGLSLQPTQLSSASISKESLLSAKKEELSSSLTTLSCHQHFKAH